MTEVLKPTPALLAKIGSIVVHAEEMASPSGHQFDMEVLKDLLKDKEVSDWLEGMRKMALIPEKRLKT